MKKLSFLLLLICSTIFGISQNSNMGVGTANPDKTAALEIKSTNQGFLLPRLTTVQRDAITGPALGLTIFNTDNNCIESWTGLDWVGNCGVVKAAFADIDCAGITVDTSGKGLQVNKALPSIQLAIAVNVTKPGVWNATGTVNPSNGYIFSGNNTVGQGSNNLVLLGVGAPQRPGIDSLHIELNGKMLACPVTLTVADVPHPNYTVNCSSVDVTHTLVTKNSPVNANDYIAVTVNVTDGTSIGQTWSASTDTASGFFYSGSGTLAMGINLFKLYASGKPSSLGTNNVITKTITFNNFGVSSTCTADIRVVLPKLTIASFGGGYYGNDLGSYLGKAFVTTAANFGPSLSSTVVTQGFTIDLQTSNSIANYLQTKKPDIILISYAYVLNAAHNTALATYLANKGVVIMLDETASGGSQTANGTLANYVGTILGYPAGTLTSYAEQYNYAAPLISINDAIMNGPFANLSVGQKFWGASGGGGLTLSGLPAGDVTVYSTYGVNNHVSMFRHKTKNFFFVGDGGLTTGLAGYTSTSDYPFWLDANNKPISKTSACNAPGFPTSVLTDNSTLFGNVLAWAIQVATTNGINQY